MIEISSKFEIDVNKVKSRSKLINKYIFDKKFLIKWR